MFDGIRQELGFIASTTKKVMVDEPVGWLKDKSFGVEARVEVVQGKEVLRNPKALHRDKDLGPLLGVGEHDFGGESGKMKVVEMGNHGRAMIDEESKGKLLVGNRGEWFAVRDTKGGNYVVWAMRIQEVGKEKSLRTEGMYNESDVQYLVDVTEFLMENELLTERIRVVWKLDEVVSRDRLETVTEWRTRVRKMIDRMDDDEKKKKYSEYIDSVNLVTVERDLQVAERIRDLGQCVSGNKFREILGEVFEVINKVAEVNGTSTLPHTSPPEKFDTNNEGDIERYLGEWLPEQMGTYLGRLRKLGMTNDFPHAQNWSLVGTLYDAQSFSGRGFDKSKGEAGYCNEEDFKHAMQQSLGVLAELFGDRLSYVNLKHRHLVERAKTSLIKSYVKEMGLSVSNMSYEFFMDNSHGIGKTDSAIRMSLITPGEWNVIRKEIDPEFVLVKEETEENWKVYKQKWGLYRAMQVNFVTNKITEPYVDLFNGAVKMVRKVLKMS